MQKAEILAAIKGAAQELGHAPSRGELKRLTGVSHYRVLTEFRTLREAIREAGLEPNKKGERVATEALMRDWERVRKKLGRRPSRAEYVREGRYSAGTLVGRFGSWSGISNTYHGDTETRRESGRESTRRTRIGRELPEMPKNPKLKVRNAESAEGNGSRGPKMGYRVGVSDKAIAFEWAASLAKIPGPLEGKRRVTEAIATMVVNTLMPAEANGNWQLAIGQNMERSTQQSALSIQSPQHAQTPRAPGAPIQPGKIHHGNTEARRITEEQHIKEDSLGPSLAVKAPLVQDDKQKRAGFAARGIYKDRPVMGPPFSRHPLTNAPVNEMGVVFLFALVAWELGFQVESLWTRGYPDGRAKREVAPGKWQDVSIEFEYESKNFVLHGHDPKKCDVIVCWRHNWKDAPDDIEIIELCSLLGAW